MAIEVGNEVVKEVEYQQKRLKCGILSPDPGAYPAPPSRRNRGEADAALAIQRQGGEPTLSEWGERGV